MKWKGEIRKKSSDLKDGKKERKRKKETRRERKRKGEREPKASQHSRTRT